MGVSLPQFPGGNRSVAFPVIRIWQLPGVVSAQQLLSRTTEMVCFRAHPDNSGDVYLGSDAGVSSDTGLPLEAGDYTPWYPVDDLSNFWYVCDSVDDKLIYMYIA